MAKKLHNTSDAGADIPKGAIEIIFEGEKYIIPASCIEKDSTTSSGPGGQHVNKTQSKAIMIVDINDAFFPAELREAIKKHPDFNSMVKDGLMEFQSSNDRSWHRNINTCVQQFRLKLNHLLHPPKERGEGEPPERKKRRKAKEKAAGKRAKFIKKKGQSRDKWSLE